MGRPEIRALTRSSSRSCRPMDRSNRSRAWSRWWRGSDDARFPALKATRSAVQLGKYRLGLGGIHDRFGSFAWLRTIRSRLYLAFGLAASLTVVGSLFALVASATVSATLHEIVSRGMPATVESFRLAEDTNSLIGSAPSLIAVEDESHRAQIANQIAAQSQNLQTRIENVRALDGSESDEIAVAHDAMA